jgi:dihydrofolate synthase/folylpolyglutamate synthase
MLEHMPEKASAAKLTGRKTRARRAAAPKRAGRTLKPSAARTPISTFQRAVGFLDSLGNFERRRIVRYTPENFNLDRVRTLCRKLGDPQLTYPVAHVAGTKGKGSTCAMLAAVLRAAGYTVGLYTSPHLIDIRERIRVLRPTQDPREFPQGEMIPAAMFARLVAEVEPAVTNARRPPTYFDVMTALAFCHFRDVDVDVAVIETGLGGRLDSTNVVSPAVTAVSAISMDHVAELGPTIQDIAREKAGIFKPGAAAFTCPQPDERVLPILRRAAADAGTTLKVLGEDIDFTWRFEAGRTTGRHNRVTFHTPRLDFEHLIVPLLGEHQSLNCGLALALADELAATGLKIDRLACETGLDGLTLEGRMEVLRHAEDGPTVITDVAHNPASIEALFRAAGQHFPSDNRVVIFGCCTDKDTLAMLRALAAGADKVIFTRIDSARGADPKDLQQLYQDEFGRISQAVDNLREAVTLARNSLGREDLLLLTGSFYLVGAAKKLFKR